MTFDQLYRTLLRRAVAGGAPAGDAEPGDAEPGDAKPGDAKPGDAGNLDRLLHPEAYAPVWAVGSCTGCGEERPDCCASCLFQAIRRREDGSVFIDPAQCVGCAACLEACRSGTLTASRDALPALAAVRDAAGPVYALIAPSFHGQFSPRLTSGQLRAAFQALGFTDMVEVALFADILTLKEAMEFGRAIRSRGEYQLTSCCCPVWISLLRRDYRRLMPHVPASVSPMIAAGRTVKALHPNALTVFVGPCLAKKAEAKEPDLRGAVDWVLTFQELLDIFQAAGIRPAELDGAEEGQASRAGRIYGRSGGVGEAVRATAERLGTEQPVRVRSADGIPGCRAMIEGLQAGRRSANFYEGMGCVGGCVGGPRAVASREEGARHVDAYGRQSRFSTPLDNPAVWKLLGRLGFETAEDFLEGDGLYTRDLS